SLGEQLLVLAQRAQAPGLLLQAHYALGRAHAFLGDWATARTHLEQAIAYMTAVSTARMHFSTAAMTPAGPPLALWPTNFECLAIPNRLCKGDGRHSRLPATWVIPPAWPRRRFFSYSSIISAGM